MKLAWKSQGLTLLRAWVDLGSSEKSSGLSYGAFSTVRKLEDLVVESMSYDRLLSICKSTNFQNHLLEEDRLHSIAV